MTVTDPPGSRPPTPSRPGGQEPPDDLTAGHVAAGHLAAGDIPPGDAPAGSATHSRAAGPRRDVVLLGESLSIEGVVAIARGAPAAISEASLERIDASRAVVEEALAAKAVVYGVTTGFGSLADVHLDTSQAAALQHRLLRSHGVAVGDELCDEEVRAMLALRAHVLSLGHSGVRRVIAERFVELLDHGILPVVPEKGSLGASGDLAPLAHLGLGAVGEGEVNWRGRRYRAADALAEAGLLPIELAAKEGLALINGTQGMTAIGVLTLARSEQLAKVADIAAACSVEAILGTDRAFSARVLELRPHPGQLASGANLRRLLEGSEILASHRESSHIVQDAYSLRCAPQVHGAYRDVLRRVRETLTIELSSVSDNPVVLLGFSEQDPAPSASERESALSLGEILSGGNFHGQPVAVVLDHLGAATVGLASISERRLYRLLDKTTNNGLPPFLVGEAGVNSGFMVCQYTAASLVSESKSLAHPASVDSIPSSAGQEDHVSMGMIAARHAREITGNAEMVVAFELLAAAQGCELRRPLESAPGVGAAVACVRERVPPLLGDRELKPDIDAVIDLVRSGELVRAVEQEIGVLA